MTQAQEERLLQQIRLGDRQAHLALMREWRRSGDMRQLPLYPMFAWLDGRPFTLDGISGVLRVERGVWSSYYGGWTRDRIYHEADQNGRSSKEYLRTQRQLGDDWSTDLTDSERLCDVAIALGYS